MTARNINVPAYLIIGINVLSCRSSLASLLKFFNLAVARRSLCIMLSIIVIDFWLVVKRIKQKNGN